MNDFDKKIEFKIIMCVLFVCSFVFFVQCKLKKYKHYSKLSLWFNMTTTYTEHSYTILSWISFASSIVLFQRCLILWFLDIIY